MRTHIFESVKDLNEFLTTLSKWKNIEIKWHSEIVSKTHGQDGINCEVVDRFFVIEK